MNCSVKIHELLFFCIYWLFSGGGIDLNLDVLNCSPVTMLSVHLCVLSSELNLHLNQISTLTNTRLNNKNNKSTLVSSFLGKTRRIHKTHISNSGKLWSECVYKLNFCTQKSWQSVVSRLHTNIIRITNHVRREETVRYHCTVFHLFLSTDFQLKTNLMERPDIKGFQTVAGDP